MSLLGHSFGRYHILEQLGIGGMAVVYRAHDTHLETDVAFKVIRTERLTEENREQTLKRFEREAKALARLTHPNIVSVRDYGEYKGKPYLVLPYLPGGTLKQMLGKPMAWREAVKLLLPVAEALDFAHRQNMIHRDVKPSNILITADGDPMLSDFGIAKILGLDETSDLTGTGMGISTPEYMAPEQWMGKTSALSDQYSLGVVLYEMLTGRKPYTADTPAAVLLKQSNEPLPRPVQFAHGLPDRVEKLLLKALAKNPADRYGSMGEFAAALESVLHGTAVPVRGQPVHLRGQTAATLEMAGQKGEAGTVQDSYAPGRFGARPGGAKTLTGALRYWPIGLLGILIIAGLLIVPRLSIGSTSGLALFPTNTPTLTLTPTSTNTPVATFTPPITPTYVPGVGSTWVSPRDGMTMLFIPAGGFLMGGDADDALAECQKFRSNCKRRWFESEEPPHLVSLGAFWMDKTEVTNSMYAKCVQAGMCDKPGEPDYANPNYAEHPVSYVDWNDASAYCAWRGDGTRLSTEAEWEKAAGWDEKRKEKRVYPWGDSINCSLANYGGCVGGTTDVGSYPSGASYYGLLDMAGNVWEWVADWYDAYPGNTITDSDYGTQYRVLRGGSWGVNDYDLRSSARNGINPVNFGYGFGFRCARGTSP